MQLRYCYLTRFDFFANLAQVNKQLLICSSLDCMSKYFSFILLFHRTTNRLLQIHVYNFLFNCGIGKGYMYFGTTANAFKGCSGNEWKVLG